MRITTGPIIDQLFQLEDEVSVRRGGAGNVPTPKMPGMVAHQVHAAMPLAARMRPKRVSDVVGQSHLLNPGRPLRAAVDTGEPHAMILHGPPGSGKTSLAQIIAESAGAEVVQLQAVDSGKADVRAALDGARDRLQRQGVRTVLFIDEIHRFNRTQQDALLPAVEDGTVTLIAATTETPYSAITPALRSRLRIYALRALDEADVMTVLQRAINSGQLAGFNADGLPAVTARTSTLQQIASRSGGDARSALGTLESAANLAASARRAILDQEDIDGGPPPALNASGTAAGLAADDLSTAESFGTGQTSATNAGIGSTPITITDQQAATVLERPVTAATSSQPHDLLSAYIKSIRGSDADAAVYYLAAMLASGEDPRTIARRLVVSASEDIGLADPQALPIAVAAAEVVDKIGMPECRIALSHATIRLALADKSNTAYRAINKAMQLVESDGIKQPPAYLRTKASPQSAPDLYVNPHTLPGCASSQQLQPVEIQPLNLVQPAVHEKAVLDRLKRSKQLRSSPSANQR